MSIKISNAYKTSLNIIEFQKLLSKLVGDYFNSSVRYLNKIKNVKLLDLSLDEINGMSKNYIKKYKLNNKTIQQLTWYDLSRIIQYSVEKCYDFDILNIFLKITLYFYENDIYFRYFNSPIVCDTLLNILKAQSVNFEYFDNIDIPDNISETDWNNRYAIWNNILHIDNSKSIDSDIICFSYEFSNHRNINNICYKFNNQ